MSGERRRSPPWRLADISWVRTCLSLHTSGYTESSQEGPRLSHLLSLFPITLSRATPHSGSPHEPPFHSSCRVSDLSPITQVVATLINRSGISVAPAQHCPARQWRMLLDKPYSGQLAQQPLYSLGPRIPCHTPSGPCLSALSFAWSSPYLSLPPHSPSLC